MTGALHMIAEAGGVFTLVPAGGKAPIGKEWQRTPHTLAEAQQHLRRGGNVGLLTGAPSDWLILLDLDTRAGDFADRWPHLCTWTVTRANAPERAKYIVRCGGVRARKNRPAGLEILSTGNHGVIAGTHESGAPIVAVLSGPIPVPAVDDLAALWQEWTGCAWERQQVARVSRFVPLESKDNDNAELRVRLLLARVPHTIADDYNEWVKVGLAVKHVCGDAGFPLWNAWSALSRKYDAEEALQKWNELAPNGSLGMGTLVYLAGSGA